MRYFFICVRDWWIGWRRGPVEALEDVLLPDPLLDEFNALERLVEERKRRETYQIHIDRIFAMTPLQRQDFYDRHANAYSMYPDGMMGYNRYANQFNQLDAMQQARNSYQDVYWQQNLLAQFGLANQQQRGWDGQG